MVNGLVLIKHFPRLKALWSIIILCPYQYPVKALMCLSWCDSTQIINQLLLHFKGNCGISESLVSGWKTLEFSSNIQIFLSVYLISPYFWKHLTVFLPLVCCSPSLPGREPQQWSHLLTKQTVRQNEHLKYDKILKKYPHHFFLNPWRKTFLITAV